MSNFAARNGGLCIGILLTILLPALAHAQNAVVSVPLMLAPDAERQGFVRIINESDEAGTVRITAVDDAGTAANPIEIQLAASQSLHFNSDDLANGNAAKGIGSIGLPRRGHWRLAVETTLEDVQVLAFVRTRAGFLTAMHDVLPRDAQGRLVVRMLNPGSNSNQVSKLRLVNTGENAERVSIAGVDDQGGNAGPVTLTLAAGQSRTMSAFDLEEGAQGLTGRLGDGAGKWRLLVTAGQSVVGVGLLETPIGPITNISTAGVPAMAMTSTQPGGQGNSFADAINLAINGRMSGEIDPAGESDYYRVRIGEAGTLTVYTTGDLDTRGFLHDGEERQLASNDDGGASDGSNFRIEHEIDAGTYYVRVEAYYRDVTGSYTLHAEFAASTNPPTDPEPPPTQGSWGAIATTPLKRDLPLRGGISWGYESISSARARALQECGHSACAVSINMTSDVRYPYYDQCAAVVRGYSSSYDNWGAITRGGDTLADAQDTALSVCRSANFSDCELWDGMAACADGSHANSNSGASGGMMIRIQP